MVMYCIIINILSKKSWLGFSLSLGFSQDKSLCLLVLVYLLLDPAYIFSIWLLNVKEYLNTLVNLLLLEI
jgi:hypothetical protein